MKSVAFLTIDNNIQSDPSIKNDMEQYLRFLWYFLELITISYMLASCQIYKMSSVICWQNPDEEDMCGFKPLGFVVKPFILASKHSKIWGMRSQYLH